MMRCCSPGPRHGFANSARRSNRLSSPPCNERASTVAIKGGHGMPNPALVMLGGARHATSVYNVARSAGYEIAHIVDPGKPDTRLYDIEILRTVEEIDALERFHFCIAVGDNYRREVIHEDLRRLLPTAIFPTLIHASAIVSLGTCIGEGTGVMPGAVIGPHTADGRFCILNTRCSIDHDGRKGDYSSMAPDVTTSSCVRN